MTEESRLRALLHLTADSTSSDGAHAALSAVRRGVHRRRVARLSVVGTAVAGVAAASVLVVTAGGSGSGTPAPPIGPFRLTGALVSFNGCDSYLRYVRDRAEKMVGPYGLSSGGYGEYRTDGLHLPAAGPVPLRAVATNSFAGSGLALPSAAPTYSTTTDQVAGVDEPDTVKTDGQLIVTLSGPTLRVLDTSAHVLGSIRLDGDTGGGLLLAGDRAVVLSSGDATQPIGFDGLVRYPDTSPATTAQAAVVDLSQPDRPRLLHTFLFDGSAVAARLVDGRVRLVLRTDGPRLEFQMPSDSVNAHAAKHVNRRLVETSRLDDWLPGWQLRSPDGSTSARHRLAGCDAIARPRHASGLSTLSVVSFDPTGDTPGPATSVVAAGETVYASAAHVYVAGVTTGRHYLPTTRIYDFATEGNDPPRFVAAGSVPGTLLSSYAMDEDAAGRLRVASTTQGRHGSDSRISVLAPSGPTLRAVGSVDGLGHGQDLRAVRFIGDVAYVVTFRNFDPLYVVDLRDPAHPHVAGRLEQPGYSEFLYPLSGDRLLGVGVGIRHNEPAQLLISTYDVSDLSHPTRIDQQELAQGFESALSTFDPHAFLSWPQDNLVVAAVPNGRGAAAYRLRADGTLSRLTTLAHDQLNPSRTLVIGDNLWAVTVSGVIVSPLHALGPGSWVHY